MPPAGAVSKVGVRAILLAQKVHLEHPKALYILTNDLKMNCA